MTAMSEVTSLPKKEHLPGKLAARLRTLPLPRPGVVRHGIPARPKRNLTATLREWHKRAGLFAFLFMAWLGSSGFLINQSASWGYDTVRVDWGWVMRLYGLRPEPPQRGYAAASHWLATTSDHVLIDARPLDVPMFEPRGFAAAASAGGQEQLFLATAHSLIVLDADGQRVDELSAPILPVADVRRLGTVPGGIAVQDLDAFASRDGGETWKAVAPADVSWSTPADLPEEQRQRLLPFARPSVSLEHVLVDAHSGRLFGNIGAWVINAVGFAAMWLAISGTWMMWRTSRRRRA